MPLLVMFYSYFCSISIACPCGVTHQKGLRKLKLCILIRDHPRRNKNYAAGIQLTGRRIGIPGQKDSLPVDQVVGMFILWEWRPIPGRQTFQQLDPWSAV